MGGQPSVSATGYSFLFKSEKVFLLGMQKMVSESPNTKAGQMLCQLVEVIRKPSFSFTRVKIF